MATLKIPALYSHYTGKQKELQVGGATIKEMLENLYQEHPAIRKHIVDSEGSMRRNINIFVNKINIVELDRLQTSLREEDVIILLPNISGGSL